jgi:predicted metal-dependent HD superfamily phosphohydrolase
VIPAPLLESLRTRYAEPQRHYHSWTHIEALLAHFRRWENEFHRSGPVLWALYWHDAIYDPAAKDNEERSARLLEHDAAKYLSEDDLAFATTIIRATATHTVPDGLSPDDMMDLSLFLDLDLSILAAHQPVYDQYEKNIRAEYAFVSEEQFRAGRTAILKGFLSRERLYFTPLAHREWEESARANLERAIGALEQSA